MYVARAIVDSGCERKGADPEFVRLERKEGNCTPMWRVPVPKALHSFRSKLGTCPERPSTASSARLSRVAQSRPEDEHGAVASRQKGHIFQHAATVNAGWRSGRKVIRMYPARA